METNHNLVISDTHFGSHQNSLTWNQYLLQFFEKQFIPYLKHLKDTSKNPINLIHTGDVYDSRTSLNPNIIQHTHDLFKQLTQYVDNFYILSGNHDHYYNENPHPCNINLTLSHISNKIKIFSGDQIYMEFLNNNEVGIFIPWFGLSNEKNLLKIKNIISQVDTPNTIFKVFCHTNLGEYSYNAILKYLSGFPKDKLMVYSGHMHNPNLSVPLPKNFINLGSVFYFNFNDTTDRFFYNLTTGETILNTTTPRYYNISSIETLNNRLSILKTSDYINLYITPESLEKNYKKIKELRKKYPNMNIIPNSFEENSYDNYEHNLQQFSKQNMLQYITQYIPTHLQDLYKSFLID